MTTDDLGCSPFFKLLAFCFLCLSLALVTVNLSYLCMELAASWALVSPSSLLGLCPEEVAQKAEVEDVDQEGEKGKNSKDFQIC